MITINRRRRMLAAVLAASALLLTACGGDDADTAANTSGGTTPAADGGTGSTEVGSPEEVLAAAYAGVLGEPPTEQAAATGDKSVWVVSCGESVPTCSAPAAAAAEAAEAAGWSADVCDGQLNPQGWGTCIRQGISAGTDGIVIIGLDCVTLQGPLQEARDAGIITIGAGGVDCDVTGGESLYSATVQNLPGVSAEDWWKQMGALQAKWIIGKTDGQAEVLSLRFADGLFGPWIQEGFEEELSASCADCSIAATVDVSNQDVGGGQLPQKFSTALLQNPGVNAVNVPLDGWFFAGLGQAVQASGRSEELAVIGNFGQPGNLDFIRNNAGQDATVGFSNAWTSWSGIDALVRLDNDMEPQPAGVGMQVVDAENNMPGAGPFEYTPPVDFRAAYRKLWGTA